VEEASTVSIISAAIAFLALLVAFRSYRRSVTAERYATYERFARMKEEVRLKVTELEVAETSHQQQWLQTSIEYLSLLDKAREGPSLDLKDSASKGRDRYLEQRESIENLFQEHLSKYQDMHEQLAALPAESTTASDILTLQTALGTLQRQEVISQQWHRESASMLARFREEIDSLRKAIDAASVD
jgi:hypothetical protein